MGRVKLTMAVEAIQDFAFSSPAAVDRVVRQSMRQPSRGSFQHPFIGDTGSHDLAQEPDQLLTAFMMEADSDEEEVVYGRM